MRRRQTQRPEYSDAASRLHSSYNQRRWLFIQVKETGLTCKSTHQFRSTAMSRWTRQLPPKAGAKAGQCALNQRDVDVV
jgi:hypothetical protein